MKMSLKKIIGFDVYRKTGCYRRKLFWKIMNRDLYCLSIYRKANYYYLKNNKFLFLIYLWKLKKICYKYDFNVSYKTNIGYGLFIGHNGPVIINGDTTIGNNCNIATGVTIGVENRGVRKGCPNIGNNVWIGTNAVLVGKINVGDNVLIAPNTFVNFDVPSNSIVLGNPGKIISRENATEFYITNKVDLQ